MTDKIELDGEQAFLASDPYNNPYSLYSDEFNRYERGWTQAMKKSAAGLLPPVIGKPKSEFPLLFPRDQEPVYRPKVDSNKAELYKKRKG